MSSSILSNPSENLQFSFRSSSSPSRLHFTIFKGRRLAWNRLSFSLLHCGILVITLRILFSRSKSAQGKVLSKASSLIPSLEIKFSDLKISEILDLIFFKLEIIQNFRFWNGQKWVMIEIVDFIVPGIHLMEEIRHMANLQYSQGTMDRLDGHHCHLDGLPMDYLLFRTDRPYRKEHQLWQW